LRYGINSFRHYICTLEIKYNNNNFHSTLAMMIRAIYLYKKINRINKYKIGEFNKKENQKAKDCNKKIRKFLRYLIIY
jgi:hypothetical protein